MKRITGRCKVTLLMASAIVAISAGAASAALPEFVPQSGGKFPIAVTAKWGVTKLMRANFGDETALQCTSTKFVGSITAAKRITGVYKLTGCIEPELAYLHNPPVGCANRGAITSHEIWTESPAPVVGELIYNNAVTHQGLDIVWNKSKKSDVVAFGCEGRPEEEEVDGEFLTPLTAGKGLISTMSLEVGLTSNDYMSRLYTTEDGNQHSAVLSDTDHWAKGLAQAAIEVESKSFTGSLSEPLEIKV